ncbi:MAG TPA: diacylglycerol kinase family protein [Candidatus Methylomirabilis sp.]|nr:diacylglycerol kinase family protein [Candidatus Methylomirabilis sp.]
MYAYIYDCFSNDPKYGKLLHKIEKRLTDLNLNGKIVRLGISKNIKVAIDDEIRQGTKTIVAVGNDNTVSQAINAIVSNQSDEKNLVTLGIIPLDEKENKIAAAFGITTIGDACEILLARRLESFNLARINQGFFLFKAILSAPDSILEIDKNFIIHNLKPMIIEATNSPHLSAEDEQKKIKLRIYNDEGESLFYLRELLIVNSGASIIADDSWKIKTPARIKIGEDKIRVIVGKERHLN